MKSRVALYLPLLIFPLSGLTGETVTLSFDDLGNFRDAAGWAVAKNVAGDKSEKRWARFEEGSGILTNGKEGKAGNLVTKAEHGDVEAHVEFMIPKGSNSGIYFQQCYEIQILDSYGKADDKLSVHDCGAVYERWDDKRDPKGFEGTVPKRNASKAPGEWQYFTIQFRAPRFDSDGKKTENARFLQVIHNGKVIIKNAEVTGPTRGGNAKEVAKGPLKIQGDHGPIAFRKFVLKRLQRD